MICDNSCGWCVKILGITLQKKSEIPTNQSLHILTHAIIITESKCSLYRGIAICLHEQNYELSQNPIWGVHDFLRNVFIDATIELFPQWSRGNILKLLHYSKFYSL